MPHADLGTAFPTRQKPTCYKMLRLPAVVQSLAREFELTVVFDTSR